MIFNLDTMPELEREITAAMQRVRMNQQFIQGPELAAFEQEFGAYTHQPYCVGVGSGTDAIRLGLMALGVKPGDEVINPAFNVAFTALAVESIGAKNVFVDCDSKLLMDLDQIPGLITDKTTCVLPVHLYGQMVDMPKLRSIANDYGLMILEDAAHAHGAQFMGPPGTWSDAVAYSFYPTKNLGALGDGGCVTTRIASVAERLKLLRDGGRTDRYLHEIVGINSCLDEIQAAVLRVKLRKLDERNDMRRRIADRYERELWGVRFPAVDPRCKHVNYLCAVLSSERDSLRSHLTRRGIPTLIHFPLPVPYQPCFMQSEMGEWPKAMEAAMEEVSLPLHPNLSYEEQSQVIEAVNEH